MSKPNKDDHNRFRSKTIAFRASPEEADLLDRYVLMSGLTKQDYIIHKLSDREVSVNGNPRVYMGLKKNLADVLAQLQRIEAGQEVDSELLDLISFITTVLSDMKDGNK